MVRQHNDQRKKDNDLQNTIQKTKDRATPQTRQSTNIGQTMNYKTLHRKH